MITFYSNIALQNAYNLNSCIKFSLEVNGFVVNMAFRQSRDWKAKWLKFISNLMFMKTGEVFIFITNKLPVSC